VARVSRAVLARNAGIASGQGIRGYATIILRADAWGHGEALVRDVLRAVGFTQATSGADAVIDPATLYGLPGGALGAVPAMRLHGAVLSVKELRAGEGVSYGFAYRARADTRVALVTGGYAQGIVRALGNRADVAIHGRRHPIVGRVAMDVCVVDIGDAAVRRGDAVVLLGDPAAAEPSVADWADATGLQPAEIITTVGLRAIREEESA
jgi:alanine racemase